MTLTTDPNDPRIKRGSPDTEPVTQNAAYLVLSDEERRKGFVKPKRYSYTHQVDRGGCGAFTTMNGTALAETYARDPWFYGATYCIGCSKHRPLKEFVWEDGEPMCPSEWPASEHQRIVELRAAEGRGILINERENKPAAGPETTDYKPPSDYERMAKIIMDTPPAAAAHEPEVGTIAWLMEWPANDNLPARWWHPVGGWMIYANKAARFVRKEDAEAFIAGVRCGQHIIATEHKFGLTPPPRAVQALIDSARTIDEAAAVRTAREIREAVAWIANNAQIADMESWNSHSNALLRAAGKCPDQQHSTADLCPTCEAPIFGEDHAKG